MTEAYPRPRPQAVDHRPGAVTSARKRAFQPPPGAWIKDWKIIDKGEIDALAGQGFAGGVTA
jgi:hypothetical protein